MLYTRRACAGGPASEVPMHGACDKRPVVAGCSAGVNPVQVFCGLPPGTWYTAVDSNACGGPGAAA